MINNYYTAIRGEIIALVPEGSNRVLDVGCGSGNTLVELKTSGRATEVVGADVVDLGQADRLDRFIHANIEKTPLPFPDNYFDVIICADVLEHFVDPWDWLRSLKRYLKPEGMIIISLPNIREIRTLLGIIKGDFRYRDSGVLDRTHLRFFAKKNIIDMVVQAECELVRIEPKISSARAIFNKLTFRLFEDFLAVQYIVVAKAPQAAALFNKDQRDLSGNRLPSGASRMM